MRRFGLVGALVIVFGSIVSLGGAKSQTSGEAAVAAAVDALTQAMLSADAAKLEQLTASELSYGHSSGKVETKAEFMAPIVSKKTIFRTLTLSDQKITLARDAAIVRHVFSSDVEADGKVTPVKISVLQVWQNADGGWKLLARQAVGIK